MVLLFVGSSKKSSPYILSDECGSRHTGFHLGFALLRGHLEGHTELFHYVIFLVRRDIVSGHTVADDICFETWSK